jgi:hypothetical protein
VNLEVQVAMGVALIAGAFLARAKTLHRTRYLPNRGVAPKSGNVRHVAVLLQ